MLAMHHQGTLVRLRGHRGHIEAAGRRAHQHHLLHWALWPQGRQRMAGDERPKRKTGQRQWPLWSHLLHHGQQVLALALTGIVDRLAKLFTPPVVRGIQLALGLVFLRKGVELIVTKDLFMSGVAGHFPDSNINLILGFVVFALVLLLLDNKRVPAAIAAVGLGIASGYLLGGLDVPTADNVRIVDSLEGHSVDSLWRLHAD